MIPALLLGIAALLIPGVASAQQAAPLRLPLARELPAFVARSLSLGRLDRSETVSLALTLPLRHQAELENFLRRVSDPNDVLYGHYLTSEQFNARYGPTAEDYAAAAAAARAQGLTVTGTHPSRMVLDVAGPSGAVESAFAVRLNQYEAPDGHLYRAPDALPAVPSALAVRLSGVVGLSDAAVRHRHAVPRQPQGRANASTGTGPQGGFSPSDIKAAYDLSAVSPNGSGQTLALFELDGYNASDINAYERQFSLPNVTLQPILLDGFSGQAGTDSDEVTLDIELGIALAPKLSKVLVYETQNTDAGTIDGYARIADDNIAKQVSSSWGLDEQETDSSLLQSEHDIFEKMAAQGQTIYAAAGDSGAYDSGNVSDGLRVDDPASQPYVCGVGATSLTTRSVGGAYESETTWNTGSVQNGAGGGGVSSVWPIPSWQQGAVSEATLGLTTMRNVPDVSLNADPDVGYAVYIGGQWQVYGGASCATPLWAGFTALVNQQRVAAGKAVLGQAAPVLYPILTNGRYNQDFHDIADGSNNLHYPAVSGYDDATGLGSFNGAYLLGELTGVNQTVNPPAAPVATFAAGLNFFSLPYDYSGVSLSSLFGYSGVNLAVWSPTLLQYEMSPTAPANQIQPGQGYWARFPQAVTVTAAGLDTDTSQPFPITLGTGWNMIGDPFPGTVTVSSLTVSYGGKTYSFASASGGAGLIRSSLYRYNPSGNAYVTLGASDSLQPDLGYWVYANHNITLEVPAP